jgi:hypothetical protein
MTFAPSQIPHLTGSIDYFYIQIKDEVGVIPYLDILQDCANTGNPVYCSQIVRQPTTGSLTGNSNAGGGYVIQKNMNLGTAIYSGVDVVGNYKLDFAPGFGDVAWALNGAYMLHNETQPIPGGTTYDCVGLFGAVCQIISPRWRHTLRTTWETPWSVSASLTWRSISRPPGMSTKCCRCEPGQATSSTGIRRSRRPTSSPAVRPTRTAPMICSVASYSSRSRRSSEFRNNLTMRSHQPPVLVVCAALSMACSSPSQHAGPVVVAQEPAGAGTSTSTAASRVTGTASANDAPAGSAVDPGLIKEGYRASRRQGRVLYCQTQTVTGTKFANTVCMTAAQIQALKRETAQSKRLLMGSVPANCVGNQCNK